MKLKDEKNESGEEMMGRLYENMKRRDADKKTKRNRHLDY